jgi:hypothetical protein
MGHEEDTNTLLDLFITLTLPSMLDESSLFEIKLAWFDLIQSIMIFL